MSVTTSADQKIIEARDHLQEAYKCLRDALDPDTWGHEDFNDEGIDKLHKLELKILKIRRQL